MNQYRYKCPTKGCEIDTILVNVHEDVIEYFGFCCPFCQDHMVRDDTHQSERDKVLNGDWVRDKFFEWVNSRERPPSIYACGKKWEELRQSKQDGE
jgi:hypothetical protein